MRKPINFSPTQRIKMSIRSRWWAIRHSLSFSDAGILDDVMSDTAGRKVKFSDGTELITCKRMSALQPVRANLSENGKLWAISKLTMHELNSPLLKEVLTIIIDFNEEHGGSHGNVSSNKKTW